MLCGSNQHSVISVARYRWQSLPPSRWVPVVRCEMQLLQISIIVIQITVRVHRFSRFLAFSLVCPALVCRPRF